MMNRHVLFLFSALDVITCCGGVAYGQVLTDLSIATRSVQTSYCFESRNQVSMRLSLEIEYSNHGSIPMLVPIFARVSSYRLFRTAGESRMSQIEGQRVYGSPRDVEMPKVPDWPDPQIFQVLAPGGKLDRLVKVAIAVGKRKGSLV